MEASQVSPSGAALGPIRTFVDDLRVPGCLHAATVRTQLSRGQLRDITLKLDHDWEQITVLTSVDVPGVNDIGGGRPALASTMIQHALTPVALVAAGTREQALQAARMVRPRVKPLPALLDFTQAAGHDIVVHGPDNVFDRVELQRGHPGRVRRGRKVRGVYTLDAQEHGSLEPQSALARPRPDGGVMVLGALQSAHQVQRAVCAVLGHERVNVVQADTGGAFGGKGVDAAMVAVHAALLAHRTKKPVKLVYSPGEHRQVSGKGGPGQVHISGRVTPSGRMLTLKIDLQLDGGAYPAATSDVLAHAVSQLLGPYSCEHVRARGRLLATNAPPRSPLRGGGASHMALAMERHMDSIARALSMDPIEVRRVNLLRPGDRTLAGQLVLRPLGAQVLEQVVAEAGRLPRPPAPGWPGAGGAARRMMPGRGVALTMMGCGLPAAGEVTAGGRVALELHRGRLVLYAGVAELGQRSGQALRKVVARTLRLPLHRVELAPRDTRVVPDAGPTGSSRTAAVLAPLVRGVARDLHAALENALGRTGPFRTLAPTHVADSPLRVERQVKGEERWDGLQWLGPAAWSWSWSAVLVELAVDIDTGEVAVSRLVTVTDAGQVLQPEVARGQLEGAALMALGAALMEQVSALSTGAARPGALCTPGITDTPELVTVLLPGRRRGDPGSSGLGELGGLAVAAAVLQAIEAASGAALQRIPATPARVLEAMP